MKNVLVRFEGGLGDCLLENRFLFAIKDKHPDANIKIVFDTDGNANQENTMRQLWPEVYANAETLPKRKNSDFLSDTIFGKQHRACDIGNSPDELKEMVSSSDVFYDLHIEALKWLRYDFDWLRYYWFFPKPSKKAIDISKYSLQEDFVLMHLYARPTSQENIPREYAKSLINEIAKSHPVVCVCFKEYFSFYDGCDCKLIDPTFVECFDISEKAKCFIGMDSGIRYVPLHCSKPTFLLSKHCHGYKKNDIPHEARWILFERNCFPINVDPKQISKIVDGVYKNSACWLYPMIPYEMIDSVVVNWFNFKEEQR